MSHCQPLAPSLSSARLSTMQTNPSTAQAPRWAEVANALLNQFIQPLIDLTLRVLNLIATLQQPTRPMPAPTEEASAPTQGAQPPTPQPTVTDRPATTVTAPVVPPRTETSDTQKHAATMKGIVDSVWCPRMRGAVPAPTLQYLRDHKVEIKTEKGPVEIDTYLKSLNRADGRSLTKQQLLLIQQALEAATTKTPATTPPEPAQRPDPTMAKKHAELVALIIKGMCPTMRQDLPDKVLQYLRSVEAMMPGAKGPQSIDAYLQSIGRADGKNLNRQQLGPIKQALEAIATAA